MNDELKQRTLNSKDAFKVRYAGQRPYFSAIVDTEERGPVEICLEPCFNGFCVAAYDPRRYPPELLVEKRCTNTPIRFYEWEAIASNPAIMGGKTHIEVMGKALDLAAEVFAEATGRPVARFTENDGERVAAQLSANLSARIDSAMFRALPVWVKRWQHSLPLFVLKIISRWYRVEIRHITESPAWEVWVRGKMVERITLEKRL